MIKRAKHLGLLCVICGAMALLVGVGGGPAELPRRSSG